MLDSFINLIESPVKSLVAVIIGTVTGYVPQALSISLNIQQSSIDTYFQHSVWLVTILVGVTALISWVQKQLDRFRKRRKEQDEIE